MRVAVAVGYLCLGIAAGVPAAEPTVTTAIQDVTPTPPPPPRPLQDGRLPGNKSANGDARWNTELAWELYEACPGTVPNAQPGPRCTRHTLMVRNESAVPIQCKGVLEYSQANRAGETRAEADRVIFPWEEARVLRSDIDDEGKPANYSADCVAVPAGPLRTVNVAPECKPALSAPPLEQFYPPGAKRRGEQGAVVLEFTTTTAPAAVKEALVVQSSGFVDLDNAALSFSKRLKATSACDAFRMRLKINFKLEDEPPAPEAPR